MGVSIPLELTAMWLYMRAIRDSSLSLTLPYLAFTPVFNILTGYVVLGETVNRNGFLGIVLVVLGAWILNLESGHTNLWRKIAAPFHAIAREPGSRMMLLVAAIYSLTSVTSKGALLHVTPAFFGPFYFVILGTAAALLFTSRDISSWGAVKHHPVAHLAIGFFMALMVITHFYAIEHIEVAYMVAVKRTSLLFGMLYGAWLFKEEGLTKNLIAGTVMVTGVYLIVT